MRRTVVLILFVLLLATCRTEEKKEEGFLEGAQQSATDSATHPASPGGTAVVPSASAGTTVLVTLADGRIVVQDPDRIPPGPAVFTITNTGTGVHHLFIEGQGVSRALGDTTIDAGGTASADVQLQPGRYTLYCPVLNHRENGESVTLVIKPPTAPPPTSTVEPVTTTT